MNIRPALRAVLPGIFISAASFAIGAENLQEAAVDRTIYPLLLWILLALFLFFSALFSGSETSLFSLDRVRLSQIQERHPHGYLYIRTLLDDPRKTLTSILFLNRFVNIGATLSAGALADYYLAGHPAASFLLGALGVTLLIIIFGEVMPKTLAIERPGAIALAASPPLIFFLRIISPVRVLLDMFNNTLFRVLHLKMAGKTETSMEEDLKVLLFSGEFDGLLEEDERDMIDGVFEMGEMTVNEVMTPRTDLEAFPITLSQEQMIAAVRGATHSRALIYEEDIDHVVGFLHVKDLFLSPQKRFRELIRPPFLVPEKKELTDLLTEMQRRRTHIAVVVDEYGGVAGVVTLNDVLAEIVGDIRDSNEAKETKDIIRVGKDHYNVAGMAELFDINETLGTSFDEDVARTISGFICNSLGRLPESGEECLIEGWRFKILKMEGNRVERIVMRMQSGAPAAGNDDHTIPQGGDHSRDGY